MMLSSSVLGLLWAVQTALLLFVILFTAFFAALLSTKSKIQNPAFGAWMFFELASTACLVIVLVELTGHIQRRLLPSEYRLLQYLKTSLWTVVVVVEVAIMAHYSVGPEKGVPIFWIMIAGLGVVWISFLTALTYGSSVYRQTQTATSEGEEAPLLTSAE